MTIHRTCLAVCSCWRCVNACSMSASHSSCILFNVAGMDVALGGFGFTIGGAKIFVMSCMSKQLHQRAYS